MVLLCFEKKCSHRNKAAECLVNFFVKMLLEEKNSMTVFGKLLCVRNDQKKYNPRCAINLIFLTNKNEILNILYF